jgi:gas vesicle protein
MAKPQNRNGFDDHAIFGGFLVGLLVGAAVALFSAPLSMSALRQRLSGMRQAVQDRLETVTPTDAVADSIAEGKAAARRRLDELGLNK